jgi:hypothetical protein
MQTYRIKRSGYWDWGGLQTRTYITEGSMSETVPILIPLKQCCDQKWVCGTIQVRDGWHGEKSSNMPTSSHFLLSQNDYCKSYIFWWNSNMSVTTWSLCSNSPEPGELNKVTVTLLSFLFSGTEGTHHGPCIGVWEPGWRYRTRQGDGWSRWGGGTRHRCSDLNSLVRIVDIFSKITK